MKAQPTHKRRREEARRRLRGKYCGPLVMRNVPNALAALTNALGMPELTGGPCRTIGSYDASRIANQSLNTTNLHR
jgi:hypothetical protein